MLCRNKIKLFSWKDQKNSYLIFTNVHECVCVHTCRQTQIGFTGATVTKKLLDTPTSREI